MQYNFVIVFFFELADVSDLNAWSVRCLEVNILSLSEVTIDKVFSPPNNQK